MDNINTITVPTDVGNIIVTQKPDTDYPGVYIEWENPKTKNKIMIACVEYDYYAKHIMASIHAFAQTDDPSAVVRFDFTQKDYEGEVRSS